MSTETNQNNNDSGKVKKQYDANMKKLIAIMGGEKNLVKSKLPKDDLSAVINELLKEEKEASAKEIKEDVKNLLKNYTQFKKDVAQKQKELKDLENNKMKEFNEAAKKVFGKINNLETFERDYYTSLGDAATAASNPSPETTEENEEN